MHIFHCLVSGSFNPPLGVLFSFPSRYYFTIGLNTYLELGVDASLFPEGYPTHSTQVLYKFFILTLTGLSPSAVYHFRKI